MHAKLLTLVTVSLCACGGGPAVPGPSPQPDPFRPEVRGVPDVDGLIGALSVRDKIAQLVVPWIPGTYAAYDAEVEIDVADLAPQVSWGTTPGMVAPVGGSVPDPSDFDDPDERAFELSDVLVELGSHELDHVLGEQD